MIAEIINKINSMWEAILGACMAVWGWIILRSIRHGEKLTHIEAKMVTSKEFEKFAEERTRKFDTFAEEQSLLMDELRATMENQTRKIRRAQRRMHRQNVRAIADLVEKARKSGGL